MNQSNTETAEILDELTSVDYDDDDALTLLDDEETPSVARVAYEDADLASFYSDIPEPKVEAPKVEKEPKEEPPKEPVVKPVIPAKEPATVDDYLNKSLEKPEVKVEKVASIKPDNPAPIVPKVEPVKERPVEVNSDNSLNQLFAKVSSNVKGASDLVNRNAEIKRKIDERLEALTKLQAEHEKNKQRDYEEITNYKNDVYNKLLAKKEELEKQMSQLKQLQITLMQEKQTFEAEKKKSQEALVQKEQELNQSYQERVKSIEQIENGLIKRKAELDQERELLQQEKEDVNKQKKELAENLVKFNQLVDDFTKGVDRFNETN